MVGGRSVFMVGFSGREYIGPVISQLLCAISQCVPSQCAICHAWPSSALCPLCVALFAQPRVRCPLCAQVANTAATPCARCVGRGQTLAWPAEIHACVPYQYPWRHLIQDFKFHGASGLALHFGRLMQQNPGINGLLAQTDWLIPMPLADGRLKERGFNQSQLLANILSPPKCHAGLLTRSVHTVAQSALSRSDRLANVEGVYRVPDRAAALLQGRHVTLLDDVMTSGASLSSATSALQSSGARVVCAVVFARAE